MPFSITPSYLIKIVTFFMVTFLLGSCAANSSNTYQLLASKRWILQESKMDTKAHRIVRIDFTPKEISILPGCNRYYGHFSIDDQRFVLGDIQHTNTSCSPLATKLDNAFVELVKNSKIVKLTSEIMILQVADGQQLEFKANPKSNQEGVIAHVWEIHPKKGSCGLGNVQQCNYIRRSKNSNWEIFPNTIEGFAFKPGISYKVKVLETKNRSGSVYTLDSVIEQTIKGTRQIIVNP